MKFNINQKNKLKKNAFRQQIRKTYLQRQFKIQRQSFYLPRQTNVTLQQMQICKNFQQLETQLNPKLFQIKTIQDFFNFVTIQEQNWYQLLEFHLLNLKNNQDAQRAENLINNLIIWMRSEQFYNQNQSFIGPKIFKHLLILIVNITFHQNQNQEDKNQQKKLSNYFYSKLFIEGDLIENIRFWISFKLFPIDRNRNCSKQTQNVLELLIWVLRNLCLNLSSDFIFQSGIIQLIIQQLQSFQQTHTMQIEEQKIYNKFQKENQIIQCLYKPFKPSYFLKCQYQMMILLSIVSIKQYSSLQYLKQIDSIAVIFQVMNHHIQSQSQSYFDEIQYGVFELPSIKTQQTWSQKIVEQCFSVLQFLFLIGQNLKDIQEPMRNNNQYQNRYKYRCKFLQLAFLNKLPIGRQFLKRHQLQSQNNNHLD